MQIHLFFKFMYCVIRFFHNLFVYYLNVFHSPKPRVSGGCPATQRSTGGRDKTRHGVVSGRHGQVPSTSLAHWRRPRVGYWPSTHQWRTGKMKFIVKISLSLGKKWNLYANCVVFFSFNYSVLSHFWAKASPISLQVFFSTSNQSSQCGSKSSRHLFLGLPRRRPQSSSTHCVDMRVISLLDNSISSWLLLFQLFTPTNAPN